MNCPTYPMRPMNGGPLDHRANAARYDPQPPDGECWDRIDLWRFEPKFNGWRALVNDKAGAVFNRHGKLLSIVQEFRPALGLLKGNGGVCPWWDCEALERRHGIGKGSLILLDWIPYSNPLPISDSRTDYIHCRDDSYAFRRTAMTEVWGEPFDWESTPFSMKTDAIYTVPSFDYKEALRFWSVAPVINEMLGCVFYEGVVAKRVDSTYKIQLRSESEETDQWIKHRFTTLPNSAS